MPSEPTLLFSLCLVALGFVSGFVNTVAGGGGLVAVPMLLLTGFTPAQALATNKLQLFFGPWVAIKRLVDAQMIDRSLASVSVVFTFTGAMAGAFVLGRLDPGILEKVVPFLLIGISVYLLLQRRPERAREPLLSPPAFAALVGTALGFYDGFFGPGVGSLWILCLATIAGQGLGRAAANANVFDLVGTIAALLIFAGSGQIVWWAGLLMGVGQLAGARLGAGLIIRDGVRWIRPLLTLTTLGAAVRMLLQQA